MTWNRALELPPLTRAVVPVNYHDDLLRVAEVESWDGVTAITWDWIRRFPERIRPRTRLARMVGCACEAGPGCPVHPVRLCDCGRPTERPERRGWCSYHCRDCRIDFNARMREKGEI